MPPKIWRWTPSSARLVSEVPESYRARARLALGSPSASPDEVEHVCNNQYENAFLYGVFHLEGRSVESRARWFMRVVICLYGVTDRSHKSFALSGYKERQ